MNWIKSLSISISILKLFLLNILITLILLFFFSSVIAFLSRFDQDLEKLHLFEMSFDECMNSDHGRVSSAQALDLDVDNLKLIEYCQSRSMITEKWNKKRVYWDYHYYTHSALNTPKVKFHGSDYFNSRNVPCSGDVGDQKLFNVWTFGGSTMQNIETSDQESIANFICQQLFKVVPTSLMNLGVGSFYSEMEIHKFMNLLKFTLGYDKVAAPDVAVFYDGFNDAKRLIWGKWSGLPAGHSEKFSSSLYVNNNFKESSYWFLKGLQEYFIFLSDNRNNIISNAILSLSNFWTRDKAATNDVLNIKVDYDFESNGKLLSSLAYLHDQKILAGMCNASQIKCLVVLQPLLVLRDSPKGNIESKHYSRMQDNNMLKLTRRFYSEVRAKIFDFESDFYSVLDLSNVVNSPPYSELEFFYDEGHTGFYGGRLIGEEIGNFMVDKYLHMK